MYCQQCNRATGYTTGCPVMQPDASCTMEQVEYSYGTDIYSTDVLQFFWYYTRMGVLEKELAGEKEVKVQLVQDVKGLQTELKEK